MPGNLAQGAKDAGGKGLKGLMSILKGAAFGGAMLAVLGFLNSEYWKKTSKVNRWRYYSSSSIPFWYCFSSHW